MLLKKPKTKWQRRKEKIVRTWRLYKETKAGLVGIGILISLIVIVLISLMVP